MLTHLTIRDYAIIESSTLTLSSGMTALTGETGAGKSILLDALGLILGGRADASSIREGASQAQISASFDLTHCPSAAAWLQERDLNEGDDTLIIRRSINNSGRSRSFINGQPAPLSDLRGLGALLVEIHGQHEHQTLMQRDTQRQLLDAYADNAALCQAVLLAEKDYRNAERALKLCRDAADSRAERIDWLNLALSEATHLGVDSAEGVRMIDTEHRRYNNTQRLYQAANDALSKLDGEQALLHQLHQINHQLSPLQELDDEAATPMVELLDSAQIQLSELSAQLNHYQSRLEVDPERLAWVETQISLLHRLARRHQVSEEEVPALQAQWQQQLDELNDGDHQEQQLAHTLSQAQDSYDRAAQALSCARSTAALQLSEEINEAMQGLGMAGGQFCVVVEQDPERRRAQGIDEVQFRVSTNPGMSPRALERVASGGELSRISLAIQVILTNCHHLPTRIFDEVDSGVGGAIAEVVGRRLRALGEHCQVLCVTHLPQVAACAHHHLQVAKRIDNGQTHTGLNTLNTSARVDEIARMLGGIEITTRLRASAKEMLKRSTKQGDE